MSDDQPIDAVAFWQSHNAEMDALIEKYIGKDRFEPPAGLDSWFRKQWYINRIRDVMFQAGRCNQALRRCKPDGKMWKQYDKTERDLELLAEHITGIVLAMG